VQEENGAEPELSANPDILIKRASATRRGKVHRKKLKPPRSLLAGVSSKENNPGPGTTATERRGKGCRSPGLKVVPEVNWAGNPSPTADKKVIRLGGMA